MKFKVSLYPSEEGYAVNVPGLPGCWSQGATAAEALANLAEAIREYIAAEIDPTDGAEVREIEVALTTAQRSTYTFTLILSGVRELTDEVCDALFGAGCNDALPGMTDGVVFLDFTREASSIQDAVLSAISAVERVGVGARVVRLEPDELMAMPECLGKIG